jgi:hypothetical protein
MADNKPPARLIRVVSAVPTQDAFVRPQSSFAEIWPTTSALTAANRWDHWLARWGYRRMAHRVRPGLYALGRPNAESPVLVTANYTLSFDALRSALPGRDAYILVLDTHGVNVWCAAGKGAFGTDELARRIEATGLAHVVRHRRLILPQLGAPGVAAHEVRRRTGFRVEYGPVRASDLAQYLDSGQATPEMRRVRFGVTDRLVLAPMELVQTFIPMLGAAAVLYVTLGAWGAVGAVAAVLAGALLFPLLLPWLPTREFSVKGFFLGGLVALAVALGAWQGGASWGLGPRIGRALALALAIPAVVAYLALNFTGATPLTSPTGVAREMRRYIRPMAILAGLGIILTIATAIWRYTGGVR